MANLPTTNNSLTQFLTQLMRIQKNAMAVVGMLNDVTTSNAQSVYVQLEDATGATQSFEVPSIGYMESEISRIDKNFNSLIGANGTDVTVRMPDGSFKKIIQTTLFKEPAAIGQLLVPSTFKSKNNWFFENFLNPLLYVSFDVTNYVQHDTQQVAYKRIILNCDTNDKIQYFTQSLNGKNDIDYTTLLNDLSAKQISYFVDDSISTLPVSIARFSGSFDVISYSDVTVPVIQPNGTTVQTKVRKYVLNTLKYTDNLQNFQNTLILKPGDSLDVGQSTQYQVDSVDTTTNSVVLKMTSGTEAIPIGVGVLNISVSAFAIKEAQINIGYNERQVIFVKAIDKTTNLTNAQFSPGAAFYSNDLVINTSTGQIKLSDYYQQEVMDFGSSILSLAKEGTIPSIYAVQPDPPVLTASNFQVVLVNSQKTDTDVINTLKKKIAQKNSLSSSIAQLDAAIQQQNQNLNTSQFTSDAARSAVQNQLNTLIQQRTSQANLYASTISDLSTTATNLPPELANPMYAVRGFFPIPAAKPSSNTLDQNVIAFVVSYRYLKTDGTAPNSTQLDYTDSNGNLVRAYFSNWTEVQSKIRTKVYDSTLGIYTWADENVQDANTVNINQIDIPISNGEQVEIRVKSISEAGWPVNPATSDWSSSVIIPFPSNLSADQEVLASLNSVLAEQTRVNFNQDLTSRGLDLHLSTSFVQKDQYFAHTPDAISSGFFDSSGTIISLFNKLKEMENTIAQLQAQISKAVGVLQVSVVDPSGQKYIVANNSLVDLFAGYYSTLVAALPAANQKGAIITSVYQLILENTAVTPLQLASQFPGGLDEGLPVSATSTDPFYSKRRYDIVPISLSALHDTNTANGNSYQVAPFQSAQQLSQYIYMRYTDIGLKNTLYGSLTGSASSIENNSLFPLSPSAGTPAAFIWDQTYTGSTPNGGGGDNAFSIHILHPDLNDGSSSLLSALNQPTGASSNPPAVYPKLVHASYFNLQVSDANGKIQTQYIPTDLTGATSSYPIKLGFYENDRYLIGSNTCGSYLFLAPSTYADVLVDGTDYLATRELDPGTKSQIVIPIVYQFRMTDFFGSGVNGTGRIGGYSTQPKNLVYTKKIGIDIQVQNESVFSFDVQITSKYKVDSPSQTSISPAANTKLSSTQTTLINKIF